MSEKDPNILLEQSNALEQLHKLRQDSDEMRLQELFNEVEQKKLFPIVPVDRHDALMVASDGTTVLRYDNERADTPGYAGSEKVVNCRFVSQDEAMKLLLKVQTGLQTQQRILNTALQFIAPK